MVNYLRAKRSLSNISQKCSFKLSSKSLCIFIDGRWQSLFDLVKLHKWWRIRVYFISRRSKRLDWFDNYHNNCFIFNSWANLLFLNSCKESSWRRSLISFCINLSSSYSRCPRSSDYSNGFCWSQNILELSYSRQ